MNFALKGQDKKQLDYAALSERFGGNQKPRALPWAKVFWPFGPLISYFVGTLEAGMK